MIGKKDTKNSIDALVKKKVKVNPFLKAGFIASAIGVGILANLANNAYKDEQIQKKLVDEMRPDYARIEEQINPLRTSQNCPDGTLSFININPENINSIREIIQKSEEIHDITLPKSIYENLDRILENNKEIQDIRNFQGQEFIVSGTTNTYKMPISLQQYGLDIITEINNEIYELINKTHETLNNNMNTIYCNNMGYNVFQSFPLTGLISFGFGGLFYRSEKRRNFKKQLEKDSELVDDEKLFLDLCESIRNCNINKMQYLSYQCAEITKILTKKPEYKEKYTPIAKKMIEDASKFSQANVYVLTPKFKRHVTEMEMRNRS